jgi:hypothetical protein
MSSSIAILRSILVVFILVVGSALIGLPASADDDSPSGTTSESAQSDSSDGDEGSSDSDESSDSDDTDQESSDGDESDTTDPVDTEDSDSGGDTSDVDESDNTTDPGDDGDPVDSDEPGSTTNPGGGDQVASEDPPVEPSPEAAVSPTPSPLASALAATVLPAAVPPAQGQVSICHSTSSAKNPFVAITIAAAGAINGHAGHGDDIIPPFNFGPGKNQHFGGLNWDSAGQATHANGCVVPSSSPDNSDSDDSDSDGPTPGPGVSDSSDSSDSDSSDSDDSDDSDSDSDGSDGDEKEAVLPFTGGPPVVPLMLGGLMTVLGVALQSSRAVQYGLRFFGQAPDEAEPELTLAAEPLTMSDVTPSAVRNRHWVAGASVLLVMAVCTATVVHRRRKE